MKSIQLFLHIHVHIHIHADVHVYAHVYVHVHVYCSTVCNHIHAKSFFSLCMSNLELPVPMIGQLSEIRELCGRFVRATNPTELGYTYDEIKGLDDINVTLLPEKKGSILHKHNEYTVQSKVSPQV